MLLQDAWTLFEKHVFPVPSTDRLFNPYHDAAPPHDQPGAAALRQDNLRRYVAHYAARPPVLVLLEAPGPWGCRFSGVPITSEAQLVDPAFPLDGRPSGTTDKPHTEYSANIFWRVMQPFFPHFFIWSTVPLHPHHAGNPLSIRTPTAGEVRAFVPLVEGLLACLQPRAVAAVGRKAEGALQQVGATARYVRHPSQGGAKLFEAGMHDLFAEIGLAPAG